MNKYTPLDYHIADNAEIYHIAIEHEGKRVADVYDEEAAKLIVRAANNHEVLLRACKTAMVVINQHISEELTCIPCTNRISQIKAAIALAEKEG